MEHLDYGNTLLVLFIIIGVIGYTNIAIIRHKALKHHSKALTRLDILKILDTIEHMKGREFEEFCVYLFNKSNLYKQVTLTQATNDGGKDIVLKNNESDTIYVECKRYDSNTLIGREIVQKLIGAMIQNGVKKGIIITTSKLNNNANKCLKDIKKNSDLDIQIVTLYNIQEMIEKYCTRSILVFLDIETQNSSTNQTNVCNSNPYR